MRVDETTARTMKALAIADVLTAAGCDADTATELGDVGWRLAAQAASWRLASEYATRHRWTDASDKTRSAVIVVLRHRETYTDAFAGFPA